MNIVRCIALGVVLCGSVFALPQMQSLTAKDTWAAAKLSKQEIQQITAAVENSVFDTPDSWEQELLVRRVGLGAAPGVIAQGTELLCGGTGNCQIFIFRKADGKWVSLFKSDAPIAESFELGPSLTHSIKDLSVSANEGEGKDGRAVYKFDGQFYQKATDSNKKPR